MLKIKFIYEEPGIKKPPTATEVSKLIENKRNYQNMRFHMMYPKNNLHEMKLLSTFGPSLTELDFLVGNFNLEHIDFSFPQLKSMDLEIYKNSFDVAQFLNTAVKLEKLKLRHCHYSQ